MDATAELSSQALESELVGLAGHLAAAHCRWLSLLAEFDTRQAWSGPGLRSCAHWLSWRVGMNLRTGFEQLRVAHALTGLPAVSAAFAAGRISYSKVRAITRVARSDNEAALLELALAGTASHLERVVRHVRQANASPSTTAERELSWRWEDDGTLMLRGRLTAEQGTRLIAAITGHIGDAPGPVDNPPPRNDHGPGHRPDHCSAEQCGPRRAERLAARRADALVSLVTGGPGISPELLVVFDTGHARDEGSLTPAARIGGGPAVSRRIAERIGCTARVRALLRDRAGNPLFLGRARRLASPAQLAALHVRDDGRCQFPGCDHTRYLHAHHIVHWLHGGRTDLDNLVLVCDLHHRLVHEQGYRVLGRGTDRTFHRPDGHPIDRVGAPTAGAAGLLPTGRFIGGDSLTPGWAGEPLDLDAALAAVLPVRSTPVAA